MQQELRKFNKDIQVTVSVDTIAEKLMKSMDWSNPNAALLVNTIIGTSLSSGKIGFIYNALNGWQDEINLTIGKVYNIDGKHLSMYNAADGEKDKVFAVEVIEIDEYRDGNKVNVKYSYSRKNDDTKLYNDSTWVDHKALTEVPAIEAMSTEAVLAIPA